MIKKFFCWLIGINMSDTCQCGHKKCTHTNGNLGCQELVEFALMTWTICRCMKFIPTSGIAADPSVAELERMLRK